MYLSKIEINNFRSIKELSIDFQKDLNVFVGKNNTGKSSIIDAIRLALGSSVNNPNPIWIREDDFYKDANKSNRTESFTIKMEFVGLNENQRTKFFEIIDFNLADMDKSIAKLEYTASWPLKNGSRLSIKKVGGPEGPDRSEIPQKILEQFSIIYLPALRDAESALAAGNKSQLAILLKNLATDDNKQSIEKLFNDSNKILSDEIFIKKIVDGINNITEIVADSDAQKSRIVAADSDFMKILRTLQVQMDGDPINDLSANGLGSNNLLYISVVLQYLKNIANDDCPILLIEEPEAHLHPQMVLSLSRYLSKNLTPQTFITTHSPTLVTDIPIDKICLLFKKESYPCCKVLKKANFDDAQKKQFSRLMDITRCTLYFAKGVILVEGISEAVLLPVLAQRMKVDLRKSQISVIPICGVAFEIFKNLFNKDVFDIPVSIITDADPEIEIPSKTTTTKDGIKKEIGDWEKAFIPNKTAICARTQNLISAFSGFENVCVKNSEITLEYDLALASEDNPLTMTKAWENCFKGSPNTLNEALIKGYQTLDEKALRIWRVICLSGNSHGKGDLASNLAEILEEKNEDGEYKYKFEVPSYIKDAISFVLRKL